MALNRTLAVQYARKWAKSTNPKFPRYGNDCTNFVSQCMLAGGWKMVGDKNFFSRKKNTEWWYGESLLTTASYTWGGAQNFSRFVAVSNRGKIVTDSTVLDLADVVQLKDGSGHVYHTMIVTGKKNSDLLLSYHTGDHLDEPLSAILGRSSGSTAIYWKMV